MENHYYQLRNFVLKIFFGAAFFLLGLDGFAQTQVNINKNGSKPDIEINISEKANVPFFAQAKRARAFDLNTDIANPQGLNTGNKIRLQLFKDKDFSSTVIRKKTDINGVTALTVKLDEFKYAFGHIVVSEDSYLITIDIPELNEQYTSRTDKETDNDFIFLLDETKIEKFEECEPILPSETDHGIRNHPDPGLQNDNLYQEKDGGLNTTGETSTFSSADPAIIDIMIVYTPAAQEWSDTYDGGINNTIASAMATANNVSANSELGIEFNLVDSRLVNYVEQGNGNDLYALRNNSDGYMDEVHQIRKDVRSDMVAIFTNSGGGVAYLLGDKYGNQDLGFSLTGIQSAKSFTFPHELAHNMGLGHYKYQNVQPGNTLWTNWPENTWSGGWRWLSTDSNMYSDVMTYQSGTYHDDGITSTRTPYFSDPDHIYIGAKAGDEVEGNGSRTLREMKHVISQYSQRIQYCTAASQKIEMLYIEKVAFGQIDNSSSTTTYSDFSYLSNNLIPQEKQILKVDLAGFGEDKQVLVWIDWNDDKVFDPLTELVFSSNESVDSPSIDVTVPLGIDPGPKRMRIRLHDVANGGNANPCGSSTYGEVEDYTIMVDEVTPCEIATIPTNLNVSDITDNSYQLAWEIKTGISYYDIRYKKIDAQDWQDVNNVVYPFHSLKNLEASTEYEVQVRSVCSGTVSDYSASIIAKTGAAGTGLSFFNQPSDTQAGRVIDTIKVELPDINGNRSLSTAEVSLSLVDNQTTGAILSGKTTVSAVDGLAVFTDVKIDNEGTFALQATSEGLPSIESNNFIIHPYVQANLIITNTANEGPGTLREAIEMANSTEVRDVISFNIDGTGPHVITLLENLPPITQPVVLDATTQSGYTPGQPVIVLDGNNVPLVANNSPDIPTGLYLTGNSTGSTIKGFIIGGFGSGDETEEQAGPASTGTGIRSITSNTIIQGNWIGLSMDGLTPNNNVWGIYLTEGNNIVGGPNEEDRNVLSGNWRFGLDMAMDSNNNRVEGNYIGTSADGSQRIWNRYGVHAGTSDNKISGNVISGNVNGLILSGSLNSILNNHIGVDPAGEKAVPNNDGIWVITSNHIIGSPGKGNLISGNKVNGIFMRNGATDNHIAANRIGTDITGSRAIPNLTGLLLEGNYTVNNTVGGVNVGEGNVISGNLNFGILDSLGANRNLIYGNFIGSDKDGKVVITNGKGGIALFGTGGNIVGGVEAGQSNVIAFNNGWGISVNSWSERNKISANQIYSNSLPGIDLGADGITQNDRDDADYGPNRLQNFPELKNPADLKGGYLDLEYSLRSTTRYSAFPLKVEFFKSDGNRQGKEYLGSDMFTEGDITKGKKGKSISLQLVPGTTLNGGDQILATATDAEGNTSEFGAEIDVTGGCAESTWYADNDGDGLGDPDDVQTSCSQPENYVINSDDCDDTDPDIGTGATWYADKDEDSSGDPDDTTTACEQPEGYVDNSDDCNDNDALINPESIWYADKDGDGFGDPNDTQNSCTQPENFVDNSDDCDDTNAEIYEGGTWYADNDGDGLGNTDIEVISCEQPEGYVRNNEDCDDTDPEIGSGPIWYADNDGDGFGDPDDTTTACTQPAGYVSNNEDCEDTDASVNPDTIWYADSDGDGFGDPNATLTGCDQPAGYVTNGEDCNDGDDQINPDTIWFADADGDGFGDPNVALSACEQPAGYVSNNEDCDDSDPAVNPADTDLCYDCDPTNDDGCEVECLGTDVLSLSEVCTDATNVHWVINNPGSCGVEVRWESRKTNEAGVILAPPGDTFFSTGISGRGPTQVTIYWPDSNGSEIKTNTNASGIPCTSSSDLSGTMGDGTNEEADPAVKVYPNPITSEGIWMHFAERNKKAHFKIVAYDLSGRKMAETMVSVDTSPTDILWEVDHSRWIEGIYILNVSSGNEIYQIKIIK